MGRGALPPPRQTAALPWGTWGCGHRCLGPPLTAWTCWSRAGHQGGELCHESESVPRGSVPWPEAEGCLCATHRPQPEGCFVPRGPPAVAASLGPDPRKKSCRSRLCSPCFHGVMSSSWTLAPFCCPPPKDLPWPLRPTWWLPGRRPQSLAPPHWSPSAEGGSAESLESRIPCAGQNPFPTSGLCRQAPTRRPVPPPLHPGRGR